MTSSALMRSSPRSIARGSSSSSRGVTKASRGPGTLADVKRDALAVARHQRGCGRILGHAQRSYDFGVDVGGFSIVMTTLFINLALMSCNIMTHQPLQILSLVPPELQRSSSLPHPLTLRLHPLQGAELSRRTYTRRGRNARLGHRQDLALHPAPQGAYTLSERYGLDFEVWSHGGWPALLLDMIPMGAARRWWERELARERLTEHELDFVLLRDHTRAPIGHLRIASSHQHIGEPIPFTKQDVCQRDT